MKAVVVRTADVQWEPGNELYGPASVYHGRQLVHVKILSDRRADGGGIAFLVKFSPPPGKLIRLIAVASSDEHVYLLEGGYCNRAGEQVRFPGDYGLNPQGHPHSAFIGRESVGLAIYAGQPDEIRELSVVDPIQPGGASGQY